jgi:hypothetical protein
MVAVVLVVEVAAGSVVVAISAVLRRLVKERPPWRIWVVGCVTCGLIWAICAL